MSAEAIFQGNSRILKRMNPYEHKRQWNTLLLVFAAIIASGSLFYTNYLVKYIGKAEHTRAEVWARTMQQQLSSDDNDFLNYVFAVRDSLSVPAIITDEKGGFISAKGLDSTKTFIDIEEKKTVRGAPAIKYDLQYFKDELASMKAHHNPIRLNIPSILGKSYWLVYYKDSKLLTQLKIFPYVQLLLIAVFLLVAYTGFNSSRKSEQNQVWVGLAKETAHQLGTPISSLMAWIELLKDKFNAENDPLLLEMDNDVKRLEIVADRFSKIGSKPILDVHVVYDVVKDYVDYFKVRVSNKIHFDLKGDIHLKAGLNTPLFDWVLENLLKNAVNAIEGTGQISIQIMGSTSKKLIYIDVSDTGKGISRSKFLTVFRPGYTTRKRGWGLGLSLTKRMIENYHNGQIFVKDSEIGKGTTFRIILKRIES